MGWGEDAWGREMICVAAATTIVITIIAHRDLANPYQEGIPSPTLPGGHNPQAATGSNRQQAATGSNRQQAAAGSNRQPQAATGSR